MISKGGTLESDWVVRGWHGAMLGVGHLSTLLHRTDLVKIATFQKRLQEHRTSTGAASRPAAQETDQQQGAQE